MSKKSVVIALPQRPAQGGNAERREADNWVQATASDQTAASNIIDLMENRNPFELAWLLWTFPARATWHWMSGQARRHD